ncbi:hypothetical protein GF358_01745 [Candidatus Woesearchaeota archaeon]|nr:hypothetical protein [Candidatus Woesearchaeota archaeon]
MRMESRNVLVVSLILTVVIFAFGILFNYGLDFIRLNNIVEVINQHELSTDAYLAEALFSDVFDSSRCSVMNSRVIDLKEEINEVGVELSSYSRFSFFNRKDFDYLKRKYFLLEMQFLSLISEVNQECNYPYVPVLFFYEIDHYPSERQGFILQEVSRKFEDNVVVLSIDKDYEDEPLVQMLVQQHEVDKAPAIIVGDEKHEGLVYEKDLSNLVQKKLNRVDIYSQAINFSYILEVLEIDREKFISNSFALLEEDISPFAKGDISLVLGRVLKNDTLLCSSLDYYKKVKTDSDEERAVLFETIASIGCGENRRKYLLKASDLWKKIGNNFRAKLDERLALNQQIKFELDDSDLNITPDFPKNVSKMVVGKSKRVLTADDVLVSQVDRVNRDWLSYQLFFSPFYEVDRLELLTEYELDREELLSVFSERLTLSQEHLREDIGWHEGARIKELRQVGFKHLTASGTIVVKLNDKWYAPDENGVFRFEVPWDKVSYPTNRYLREDVVLIVDTHGISMLVEQAVRNNATVVIGCGDHPGKAKAAKYLSDKGITTVTFTDKYFPLLLGADVDVFPNPPIKYQGYTDIIGGRPIEFDLNETFIVTDVNSTQYSFSYYDTPSRYFGILQKHYPLNVYTYYVDDFDEMYFVLDKAREVNATAAGLRVYDSDDYYAVKEWLDEDKKRRAILFHSMPYPYGYMIMQEYPEQVTFGDLNPIFR